MAHFHSNALIGAGGQGGAAFKIDRSLRFNPDDGSHLSRTPSSAGNRKTFTFSCWVKRSTSGTTDHLLQSGDNYFRFQSSDEIIFYTSGSTSVYVDAKFSDPSAWYSIILAVDTTKATATDRIKIYVNGEQKTLTAVGSLPSQNADLAINNNAVHYIGSEGSSASSSMLSGYLADVYFIDGSQLDATSFGAFDDNGVWQAAAYSGTFGTNGFHLKFADNSSNAALGTDSSGNSNTWTVNNLSVAGPGISNATSYFDTVTYTGNGGTQTISGLNFQSDLVWIKRRNSTNDHVLQDSIRGSGVFLSSNTTSGDQSNGGTGSSSLGVQSFNSGGFTLGAGTGVNASGGTYVAWCWKAGSSNTSVTTGSLNSSYYNQSQTWSSATFFNNNGYAFYNSGGSATQLFDNVESGPGSNGDFPLPVDGGTFTLTFTQFSSATTVELEVEGTGNALKINGSFVTIPSGSPVTATYSVSGLTTIEWLYNGGSNYCYVGSIKVDGVKLVNNGVSVTNVPSIASTTRANNSSGFSIVSYTGNSSIRQTVAHGLSTAPELIIVKNRDYTDRWGVYHTSVGGGNTLVLNSSTGPTGGTGVWGNTSPDSSVFTISNDPEANRNGSDYIAYCFAPVSGFSKFGSYSGGTNPKTITTGFKPAFLLIKRSDGSNEWVIIDSKRGGTKKLSPSLNVAENDGTYLGGDSANTVEFLADGFKLTSTNAETNGSGQTHVYAAFAGTPDSTVIDSLIDTPTNYEADSGNNGGNYCTFNPLRNGATLSNGNLDVSSSSDGVNSFGTFGVSSGKWYWEVTISSKVNFHYPGIGVNTDLSQPNNQQSGGANDPDGYMYLASAQTFNNDNTSSYGSSYDAGDVIGVALDMDAGTITFYKNGVSQGQAFSSITGTAVPVVISFTGSACSANFGQRPFAISSVPTGFKALCTQNLADPTIADGSTAFDIDLYTGTNASLERSNFAFSPDFLWFKSRNAARTHVLIDTVRSRAKALESNNNAAEFTSDANRDLVSFDSDGFTVGETQNFSSVNRSGDSIVVWGWDAGTSTASNTDGSITSSVRVNQSAGFSIATYTGNGTTNSTVGHGLNAAPSFVIIKNRSNSYSWAVLHTSAGTTGTTLDGSAEYYMLQLDSSAARNNFTNDNIWNPTSSTFKINGSGTANWVNANGDNYVAYSWAPVAGYSAFGSYTGNGSFTDGPFIYLGFRPAFFLLKSTTGTYNWHIIDSTRSPSNAVDDVLRPNLNSSEVENYGGIKAIFCANGIKLNANWLNVNNNGDTFVYAAFAENPFQANGGLAR